MTAHTVYRRVLRCYTLRLIAIATAISLFTIPNALAQGEHSRRIAAELAVLAADIRLLQKPDIPPHHAVGLRERIKGGLTGLDILARLADQERNELPTPRHAIAKSLRDDLNHDRLTSMSDKVNQLLIQYPLLVPILNIKNTDSFKQLHAQLCSACHDYPNLNTERPAYNLSEQTQTTDSVEMFARMLIGVRGDRITGIDNPLSDLQIIGLLTYYQRSEIPKTQ